jgi:uncharacterized protein (TIGR03066 family)
MKWICFLLAVVLFPLAAYADAIDGSKLIGSWKASSTDFVQTASFGKDGNYAIYIKMTGFERIESGTWKLAGDTLTLSCTKSTDSSRVGQDHPMTVKEVTDIVLVLQDGPDPEDAVSFVRDKP